MPELSSQSKFDPANIEDATKPLETVDNLNVPRRTITMNPRQATQNNLNESLFRKINARYSAPKMDLSEFFREAWPILEPSNELIDNWHIDLLAEHLTMVTNGDITRLLINLPPRNFKSNGVTILWPVWSWITRPSLRYIFCSYSASLSTKHSIDRRRIIESDWFQSRWGGIVSLSEDQNQKHEYENTARGHMISTSVGGTITGKGGDIIVEDDMLNPQFADSEATRRHSLDMHKNVLSTRLDNPKTGARVIVEQRTHVNDVTGHILSNEPGYVHLNLPLMFEKRTVISFPMSKKEIVKEPGDYLNPRRQSKKEFDDMKQAMGSRTFQAQAQQNPTSDMGNIIRRGWWNFWEDKIQNYKPEFWIQSWDMSFLKTEKGSYVVGQVWAKSGNKYFLVDQVRERMDFTDTLNAMVNLTVRYPQCTAKLVEDKANGPAVMSVLKKKIDGIISVTPQGGKLSRCQSIAPLIEAGNVYIPDPIKYAWAGDFIEECAAFKGISGEINDQVDSMSQALVKLREVTRQKERVEEVSFLDEENYDMTAVGGFS